MPKKTIYVTNDETAKIIAQRLVVPDWAPKPNYPGVQNGYTIGQNNRNGNIIAKSDNGETVEFAKPPNVNTVVSRGSVSIYHDQSNLGSRVVKGEIGNQIVSDGNPINTRNKQSQSSLDNCDDQGGGSGQPPNEPEEPEEPEPPPEPNAPEPNDPEEPDEPPEEPGEGCSPESDCQWYNSPNGDSSNCPAGTTYKGFAELAGGKFKVLCCGEERPAGDGCPEDPEIYGWQCINGTCEQLPAGLYATKAECEETCNQDENCLPWACENDTCTNVGCGGQYSTLEECQAVCGPPFFGGQCGDPPSELVYYRYKIESFNENGLETRVIDLTYGHIGIEYGRSGNSKITWALNGDGVRDRGVNTNENNSYPTLTILERLDGQPDDCGNPDSVEEP
jgi:hypothetical protein